MTADRYYKGGAKRPHSRILVPRTKNSSLTIGGAIRARVPGRFAIGMRRQVRIHRHARAREPHRYKHLHVSPPAPGSRNITFFTFYGGRKFVRFVAPLRRDEEGERERRIKMPLFADARDVGIE